MYEVFINNKRLVFAHPDSGKMYSSGWNRINSGEKIITDEIIGQLSDDNPASKLVVFTKDSANSWDSFFKGYKLIEAAGGIVINEDKHILLIYRNGKWDLPKGKMEKGETPETAAFREVQEETGILHLVPGRAVSNTHHTYILKGKPVLKKTYWFEMHAAKSQQFHPQSEEGITIVKWMDSAEIRSAMENSYALIELLLQPYSVDAAS